MTERAAAASEINEVDRTLYRFERNLVLAASAGTGKTYRLASLYAFQSIGLRWMDYAPIDPRELVALTFSHAAAQEMRQRVAAFLAELSQWEPSRPTTALQRSASEVLVDLSDAFPTLTPPSGATFRANADRALLSLPFAPITTFHSFAGQLVRRHAHRVGLSSSFTLEGPSETHARQRRALLDVITASLPDPSQAIGDLLATAGSPELALDMIAERLVALRGRYGRTLPLSAPSHDEALRQIVRALGEAASALSSSSNRRTAEAAAAVRDALARDGETYSAATMASIAGFVQLRSNAELNEQLVPIRDQIPAGSASERGQWLQAMFTNAHDLNTRDAQLCTLLQDAYVRAQELAIRMGSIGHNDAMSLAVELLREHPDLAQEESQRTRALLIDEFQDTDEVQRDLLLLLHEQDESRARRPKGALPSTNNLRQQGLLLVGDRKQAIYGFRGADVGIFTRLTLDLCGNTAANALQLPLPSTPAKAPPSVQAADFASLNRSHRSTPELLAFVNRYAQLCFAQANAEATAFEQRQSLFAVEDAHPLTPRNTKLIYSDSEWLHAANSGTASAEGSTETCAVHLVVPVRLEEGAAQEGAWADAKLCVMALLAHQREHSAQTGSPRPWNHFGVLARRREELAAIEAVLKQEAIPFTRRDSNFLNSEEVTDLLALLVLVENPSDRLSLATVLRSPLVGLEDHTLLALCLPSLGLQEWSSEAESRLLADGIAADQVARMRLYRERIEALRKNVQGLPARIALNHAYAAFSVLEIYRAMPFAEERMANLSRLRTLSYDDSPTLAFVRKLRSRSEHAQEREQVDGNDLSGGVQLLTQHASKGLDFKVVVLVGLQKRGGRTTTPPLTTLERRKHADQVLILNHSIRNPSFQRDGGASMDLKNPLTGVLRQQLAARDALEGARLAYVAATRAREALLILDPAPDEAAAFPLQVARDLIHSAPQWIARLELSPADSLTSASGPWAPDADGEPGQCIPGQGIPGECHTPALPVLADHLVVAPPTLTIATTPLSLFADCPRRFALRQLYGFSEEHAATALNDSRTESSATVPSASADAGHQGTLVHRILELLDIKIWGLASTTAEHLATKTSLTARIAAWAPELEPSQQQAIVSAALRWNSSRYAQSLRQAGAAIDRERRFHARLVGSESDSLALHLTGSLDLLVQHPGNLVDVLDYKFTPRPKNLDRHDFQLQAYGVAATQLFPSAEIRIGLVFLGELEPEPVFLPKRPTFSEELRAHARALFDARRENQFRGIPRPNCDRLHCGFVRQCWGESSTP
jgi:ATP-dependent helicase/nuclease subunit A